MSLDHIKKDLFGRAEHLSLDTKTAQLEEIKRIIYLKSKITVRSASIQNNTIKLTVAHPVMAAELFQYKPVILKAVNQKLESEYNHISIMSVME